MKFAFSSLACPDWDFQALASKAREYGYQGVELRAFADESAGEKSNVFLSNPAKTLEIFTGQNIEIACLSTSVSYTGKSGLDARGESQLKQAIEIARSLKCPFVKLFDFKLSPGQNKLARIVEMGHWITGAADFAGKNGVTLLVENQLSCRNARDLWALHESCGHKSVRVCLDTLSAAVVGEKPEVAVPLLASKLGLVQIKDAWLRDNGATWCMPGEGDVEIEEYFNRLRGVGYGGWISFEWERMYLPNLASAEEVLPLAIAAMKEFTHPQLVELVEEITKVPAKGAGE